MAFKFGENKRILFKIKKIKVIKFDRRNFQKFQNYKFVNIAESMNVLDVDTETAGKGYLFMFILFKKLV